MPIHVTTRRQVKAGQERNFEEAITSFFQESFREQGVIGTYLLKPLANDAPGEYGILRSVQDEQTRDRFYSSEIFKAWEQEVKKFVEGEPVREELHGLELWFRDGQPSKWKMAWLTWIGVWPVSTLIGGLASSWLPPETNPWAAGALVSALIVLALTWPVMPLLTYLCRKWLRNH